MDSIKTALGIVDEAIGWIFRIAAVLCLAVVLGLFLYVVFLRFFIRFIPSLPSFMALDEVSELCLVWMIFIGSAELYRTHSHFIVDFIVVRFTGTRFLSVLTIVTSFFTAIFGYVIATAALELISRSHMQLTYLPFNKGVFYVVIPILGFIIVVYSFKDIVLHIVRLVDGPPPAQAQAPEKS